MRCGFRDEGEVGLTVDTRRKIAGLVFGAAIMVDFWQGEANPQLRKILFVLVWTASWFRYRNSGFYHEQIQWPDSMGVIMYLYYISLASIQAVFYGVGIVGMLGVMDIIPIYTNDFVLKGAWALAMVVLPLSLSMLSECWDLHDKWAVHSGNTPINNFVDESIKGFWKGQFGPACFDTGTWWLIDFFLLIMLWPIYMMFGEPFPVEDKWFIGLGLVYTNFLILQGYLYIRYRKEGL